MTVTADTLQDLIIAALITQDDQGHYPTGLAANVFAPRDWPITSDEMPIGLLQSPSEHKQSLGRSGAQQFTVNATFRLVVRVSGKAQAADAGAAAVLAVLAVLQRQIEVAVINNYDLELQIQQIASITVTNGVSKDGELHFGELVMDFDLEFYQGPEDFAPIAATPMDELALYADLVNVYSPTGTFDAGLEPFDAALPSPRGSGPDGRPEGLLLFDLNPVPPPPIDAGDLDFDEPGNPHIAS